MRRTICWAFLAYAVAFGLVGCGSSGAGATPTDAGTASIVNCGDTLTDGGTSPRPGTHAPGFPHDVVIASSQDWQSLVASGCSIVTGSLTITAPGLANLPGSASIRSVNGNLLIQGNTALTTISGLEALTSVGGSLEIRENSALNSLSGLNALTTVGAALPVCPSGAFCVVLKVMNNRSLTSLSGLDALTTVNGGVVVGENTALTTLSGLDALATFSALEIEQNPALTSLAGLHAPTALPGGLMIESNPALRTLAGLNALTAIGRILIISGNATLTSLAGLDALTTLGYGEPGCPPGPSCIVLGIRANNSLTSLSALDALTSVVGNLGIEGNTALPECLAVAFKEHLASAHEWTGIATISGNDTTATCP